MATTNQDPNWSNVLIAIADVVIKPKASHKEIYKAYVNHLAELSYALAPFVEHNLSKAYLECDKEFAAKHNVTLRTLQTWRNRLAPFVATIHTFC